MRASCESYAVGASILLRTFLISSVFGRCLVESFDRVWGKDYVLGVSFHLILTKFTHPTRLISGGGAIVVLIARQRCRFRTVRLLEEPHRPARRSIKFNVSHQNPVLCALCLQNKHCFLILFAKHWVYWCLCVCI